MSRARDYVILFEEYNFRFEKVELAHITKLHNEGKTYKELARMFNRPQTEIVLALLYQADSRQVDIKPVSKG